MNAKSLRALAVGLEIDWRKNQPRPGGSVMLPKVQSVRWSIGEEAYDPLVLAAVVVLDEVFVF